MTNEEFTKFFIDNIDIMSESGCYHPNSDKGKMIKLFVELIDARIESLNQKPKRTRKKKEDGG